MLENLLDTNVSFYRDSFDILKGTIPTSATYSISFDYETFFSVTATSSEDTTIYLTGDRTEAFSFYANYEEAHQGRVGFNTLTAITSTLSATGGTISIMSTNEFGKPIKCNWPLATYPCRVIRRDFVFPYTPVGEVDSGELRLACGSTGMRIGDTATYDGNTYNVVSLSEISGIAGFEHVELILKRR